MILNSVCQSLNRMGIEQPIIYGKRFNEYPLFQPSKPFRYRKKSFGFRKLLGDDPPGDALGWPWAPEEATDDRSTFSNF